MKMKDNEESSVTPNLHLVSLKINNDTENALNPVSSWFDSGAFMIADEFVAIKARDHDKQYFASNGGFAGCSGYIHYNHDLMGNVVISFSNPVWGRCKVNVGVFKEKSEESDLKSVWDNMSDWVEKKVYCKIDDEFSYDMVNTTGDVCSAIVNFYDYV